MTCLWPKSFRPLQRHFAQAVLSPLKLIATKTLAVTLNVELERQRSQFQEIVTCCENLADRIGKSQRDRLTIAVNAGIEVELGKAENVAQDRFQVHRAPLYPNPI